MNTFIVRTSFAALLCTTFLCSKSIGSMPGASKAKGNPPPNIVFIFTDDHAWQAIGAYGSNRNTTPNMDRLAKEGIRFTNCCVTNSICGPSRAVVQTGKYGHLNGFMANATDKFDMDQVTFPKLLQKAGYETAIVGKWHLECDVRGYDYSEVLIGQGPYFNPVMIRNGKRVGHEGYVTDIITELTLKWLKEGRDPSRPFLIMSQHKATHRPWDPIPRFYEKYKDVEFDLPETFHDDYRNRSRAAIESDMTIGETMNHRDLKLLPADRSLTERQKEDWEAMFEPRRREFRQRIAKGTHEEKARWKYQCYMKDYMSCVASVDESIGKILDYLDESGLAENTVVIYASDQGFYLGEHGWFDKRFMYDESFKTPLLVRWPGRIKPESVCEAIVSNLDFAETILEIAGVPVPEEMQGKSLVPLLEGTKPPDWRTSFFYDYNEFYFAHFVKKHYGVYDGRYKLIHYYENIDEWELFDLANDPQELENVYNAPDYAKERKRLNDELERLKKELKVPPRKVDTSPTFESMNPPAQLLNRLLSNIKEREERQKERIRLGKGTIEP